MYCHVTGIAGCGATVVHDLVYNPAEGKLLYLSMLSSVSKSNE